MQKYLKFMGIFILKLLIGLAVFISASLLISYFFHFTLSDTFSVLGILIFLCGLLSVFGGMNMTSDTKYYQAISVSEKSFGDKVRQEFKERNKKIGFLIYMVLLGGILILIGYLII